MTTALELINDAFDTLEIKSAESDLQTSEVDVAIRRLNRMMTAWARKGLKMGYTKITDSSQLITAPDWAEEAMVIHLAVRLAPAFSIPVTQEMYILATEAHKDLMRNLIHLPDPDFPSTMPKGSGNSVYDNSNFFSITDSDLLDLNDDNIDTETGINLSTD